MPKDRVVEQERKPVTYTLLEDIGELSSNENRKKRVTIGKWEKGAAKIDIRTWKRRKESGEWYPTKGISLNYEEVSSLKELIDKMVDQIVEHEENEEKSKGKGKKKEEKEEEKKEETKKKGKAKGKKGD